MKSTSIVLGVSIMAVPERKERVDRLVSQLSLPASQVSWDTQHKGHIFNWWRAAAIASTSPVTHALILEDDAEPCRDFLTAVENIIIQYPERIISFFSVSKTSLEPTNALKLLPHHGFSDVAVVYPVSWLQTFRKDYEQTVIDTELETYGADQLRMKLYPHLRMWCTYPSLVQHGCPTTSTLGHRFARSLARPCLDVNSSALTLDWSLL